MSASSRTISRQSFNTILALILVGHKGGQFFPCLQICREHSPLIAIKQILNNLASLNFQTKFYKVGAFDHSNFFQTTTVIYTSGRKFLAYPRMKTPVEIGLRYYRSSRTQSTSLVHVS